MGGRPRHLPWSVAAIVLVAGFAAALAWWSLRRPAVAATAVDGGRVTALDRKGLALWHRDFARAKPTVSLVDVMGDARAEVVVALAALDSAMKVGDPDIFVISPEGEDVGRLSSTLGSTAARGAAPAARVAAPRVFPVDLDGDGRLDLAWSTVPSGSNPCLVGAWQARTSREPSVMLVNSGPVDGAISADLDGDGRTELLLVGANVPLGHQLALVVLKPGMERGSRRQVEASSPDRHDAWLSSRQADATALLAYAVLGPLTQAAAVARAGPGGIGLKVGDTVVELDAAANPRGSRLEGQGWMPGLAAWDALATTCSRIESGTAPRPALATLEAEHAAVLAEPAMRLAGTLGIAGSLARSGQNQEAVAALQAAARPGAESPDLWLRLGEQLAIVGRVAEADAALAHACSIRPGGQGLPAAAVSRALLVAWHGPEGAFGPGLRRCVDPAGGESTAQLAVDLEALRAFSRAEWTHPSLDEHEPPPVLPALRVLRLWAHLERRAPTEEVRQRASAWLDDPGIDELAALLMATIEIRDGSAARAVGRAEGALGALQEKGREDWQIFAWVPLAESVLARALVASGRSAAAIPHRERASALAPATWFGTAPATRWTRQ